jgi:hypothetical protein
MSRRVVTIVTARRDILEDATPAGLRSNGTADDGLLFRNGIQPPTPSIWATADGGHCVRHQGYLSVQWTSI